MYKFEQLDADIDMENCKGTWTAPIWMSPRHWAGGGASGEVDMLEQCPNDKICSNFAGGGSARCWSFDPDNFHGHMTMRKHTNGDVLVSVCTGSGPCSESGAAKYNNIYGSNGCASWLSSDLKCMYTMISDIWLGTSGDQGYHYCSRGTYKRDSKCGFSITNIKIKSAQPFTGKCAVLNA